MTPFLTSVRYTWLGFGDYIDDEVLGVEFLLDAIIRAEHEHKTQK